MDKLTKQQIRDDLLHKLKTLPASYKQYIEQNFYNLLFDSFIWQEAKTIGITYARSFEWDTSPIINQAWREGKIVSLPRVNQKTKNIDFYRINSFTDLTVGYANILEPKNHLNKPLLKKEINLLIVPGIAFNLKGYRIGFGGGYYDRYLFNYPNNTVSLVSEIQIIDYIPIEKHDLAVQYIITEKEFIVTNLT